MSDPTPPPTFRPRQLVQFVGVHGSADGPIGRVWRVTPHGVWVTLPNGTRQRWHPDDVRPAPLPPATNDTR